MASQNKIMEELSYNVNQEIKARVESIMSNRKYLLNLYRPLPPPLLFLLGFFFFQFLVYIVFFWSRGIQIHLGIQTRYWIQNSF